MALERLENKIKKAFASISVITYALVVIFGTGSWIAINGLWVELPLIVPEIPESWSLPSYLTVMIQLANIAPLTFAVGNKLFPRVVREVPVIYISVLVGITSCVLLVFFWKETSYIAGAERSTALLVLCFFLSMVDCTSSVSFIPYMAIFREVYMSPYFAGEGLSGLLPSLVALAQGVGGGSHNPCPAPSPTEAPLNGTNGTSGNATDSGSWGLEPKFSVEVFFWFLSAMMTACGLAFLALNTLPINKRQQVGKDSKSLYHISPQPSESGLELSPMDEKNEKNEVVIDEDLSQGGVLFLLLIIALAGGLSNGILPAIQSYACIPYSYYIYHLTLTLSAIANPVTCILFPFISTTSVVVISALTIMYFGMCTYILVVASQSPDVLMKCDNSGAVLIVSILIFHYLNIGYYMAVARYDIFF